MSEALTDLLRQMVREEVERALAERPPADEYLTTRQAGELARVHPRTVRRWIAEGRLAEHRAGREVRVCRADLERLMRTGRSSSRPTRGRDLSDAEIDAMARRDDG